jgi:hypothetical protein
VETNAIEGLACAYGKRPEMSSILNLSRDLYNSLNSLNLLLTIYLPYIFINIVNNS